MTSKMQDNEGNSGVIRDWWKHWYDECNVADSLEWDVNEILRQPNIEVYLFICITVGYADGATICTD